MRIKRMKLSDLKQGPVRQEALPDGFIIRMQKYKKILEEVETTSLEKTINTFQRDWDPESELVVWEKIAKVYDDFISQRPEYTLEQKKEVFNKILSEVLGMK